MEVEINNIQDLELFILNNDLNIREIENLVFEGVGAFPSTVDKELLIKEIKGFILEWQGTPRCDKPLFI